MMSRLTPQHFIQKLNLEVGVMKIDICVLHFQPVKYFMVISPTSTLNFLIKFGGDDRSSLQICIKKFINLPLQMDIPSFC